MLAKLYTSIIRIIQVMADLILIHDIFQI